MTIEIYKKIEDRLVVVKKKYSSEQLDYLRIASVEQFANILYNIESDRNMCMHFGKYLLKYLDKLLLVGSSTLNKTYVEEIKAKYYSPVLRYLGKKHKYYRRGWWSIMIFLVLPVDYILFLTGLLSDNFIPAFAILYFIKVQIEYFYKKRIGKVLIEDR